MSQTVITQAFEELKAQEAANGGVLTLDEFVFASVPDLNITDPIDRNEGMPPSEQIVHRQSVSKTGMVNSNAVVYSVVLGADVGDFEFNWVGLLNKDSGVVAMIVHAPSQKKIRTQSGQQGNVLTRSFLMEYSGASSETQITTPADTWQIDFTARLNGVDERIRKENKDTYGAASFLKDGFLVTGANGNYLVKKGAAYIEGLRAELMFDQSVAVASRPAKIWVDVCWRGTLTSVWASATNITVADKLDNYVSGDEQHYVFAIADILADGSVVDLRNSSLVAQVAGLSAEPNTIPYFDKDAKLSKSEINDFSRSMLAIPDVKGVLEKLGLEGADTLRSEIKDPNGAVNYPELQIARWRDEGDVRGWGAKGNGIEDDTDAIQQALQESFQVVIPDGTFIQTRALALPKYTLLRGIDKKTSVIKMGDGVDQVHHSLVSANATSLDARLATDTTVDVLIGGYVDGITVQDLTIDANVYNRPKTYSDREQGSAIELQAVRHATLTNLLVKAGPQHCINVRAGTGSFNLGYDYVEKLPSQHVRITDCETYDQLYDDGITTHDSEFIWIERCGVYMPRNSSNLSVVANSNGIEIDDGSRYVWVTDCYSNGGFGGYQAKGHANTPPAHHVWFRNCVAENNHMPWVISAVDSPTTDLNSVYATCHHIYLDGCTIKNCYVMSNVSAWNAEAHYIQFYNARHVYINKLQVIGKTIDMPNMGSVQKVWFRARDYNSFIFLKDTSLINVDERAVDDSPLFTLESNISDLTINGLTIDRFVKGPVLYTNATGINFNIDNVTLQQGSPEYPVLRINGVGGGTLRLGKVKGGGFSVPFQSNSISADIINYQDYVVINDGNSNTFHEVSAATDAAGMNSLVNGVLGIGSQHVVKVGATKYPVGSIFTQVQSGNINDTTASGRMRIAVRAPGSTTPTGVMNVSKASLQPAVDNVTSGGTGGLRFSQFFAGNSTVGTSDATRKRGLRFPTDNELAAFAEISRLPSVWQWIAKYESEGDAARLHSGPTVQACIQVMEKHGLIWSDYSCFCYDEWGDTPATYVIQPAIYDQEGKILRDEQVVVDEPEKTAGSVYSLRKEELLWWCIRAQVSQIDLMNERLALLESK